MSMEAVAGAEQYKFNKDYASKAAWHNTVLAFTRNVVGPMDYTPVTFSDAKFPHLTTYGHELALSIVFESGLQHFADSVAAYRALPKFALDVLKAVPAAWEETKLLAGEPGSLVVVARKGSGRLVYRGDQRPGDAADGARGPVGSRAGSAHSVDRHRWLRPSRACQRDADREGGGDADGRPPAARRIRGEGRPLRYGEGSWRSDAANRGGGRQK